MTSANSKTEKSGKLDLFAISWPIFVETALMTLIGTLGLWMAGHVSPAAVAIFGLSNQLRAMFDRLFRVVGIGTSVVVTQHRGAGDTDGARAVARAGFAASVWTGLAALLLVGIWPRALLRLLQLPAELMDLAIPFIAVVGVALALDSINITMFSVLRAFTFTKDSMRLVMAMNILHVLVSFPLVFGFGPMPALGLMGLGYGLLASRALVFVLLVIIWARRLGIILRWRDALLVPREPLSAITHIGLPSAGEKIAFRLCFIATVAMAGSMGASALATHAYAMNVISIINIVVVAVGAGSEIIIGHHVGAGHLHGARSVLLRALRISLLATLTGGVVAWLIAPHAVGALNNRPDISALLSTILLIEIVAGLGRTTNVIVMGGLRATGDARWPVKISVVVNVVLGTALAWLLGVYFGWGLPGLWIGYLADECVRGIAMWLRWFYLGWTTQARAARRRVLNKRRAVLLAQGLA
ncbi:MAG TPA: MATE family efflux transporter [Rhodocyclaceae bacterium]|nr:MATE family efflux transporter [Rhodocyclaceae bacterium]